MKKINKKMVREIIENIKGDIEIMKSDGYPGIGQHLQSAKNDLGLLEAVVNDGYPMNSKTIKDVVERNYKNQD